MDVDEASKEECAPPAYNICFYVRVCVCAAMNK